MTSRVRWVQPPDSPFRSRDTAPPHALPAGWGSWGPGETVRPTLARLLGLGWLPVSLRLQSGHLAVPAGFRPRLQLGNPLLQALDDRLLPDEQVPLLGIIAQQRVSVKSGEVNFRGHSKYMT